MAPLIVQAIATLLARLKYRWRDAARIGLAAMFLFTGGSHFSSLARDMAAMIPPPLTGSLWVIYLTGVLECAGAVGLLTRRWRRPAALGLVALLVGLLPANVYAAVSGVPLGGNPPSALWWRVPLQVFWIAVLWWSSVGRERGGWISR